MDGELLSETFVELTDTLVAGFDVIDFLHVLTDRSVQLLDVSAAGLLLADPRGELRVVAASSEAARLLELFQIQNDQGPCLDCFRSGRPVAAADLAAAAARWPRFAPAARQAGFAAVQALPMRLREQVIGALNLFRADPGALAPADIRVGQALADVATISLLHERSMRHSDTLNEQLQTALNSRVIIEQAKGKLAERLGVDMDQAFSLLRDRARASNRRLSDLARAFVDGTEDPRRSEREQDPAAAARPTDSRASSPRRAERTRVCFSPQADVAGGVLICAIGIDAVRHISQRREFIALAWIPVLLGAHQFIEALVWLWLQGHVPRGIGHVALWAYLLIAFVVLPVFIPLAVIAVEPTRRRKQMMAPFALLGAVIAVTLLAAMVRGPVGVKLAPYHLSYSLRVSDGFLVVALYVVAVCGPLLVSGYRNVALFGVVNLVAVIVIARLTISGFASVWCGWAALTSAAITLHCRFARPHPQRAGSGPDGLISAG